jgi:hypothetical protein
MADPTDVGRLIHDDHYTVDTYHVSRLTNAEVTHENVSVFGRAQLTRLVGRDFSNRLSSWRE